ncbi:MAG: hypothetical protein KA327_10935, partial [Pseudarcicella sp.]|nr:hypothetical protein [Pseudarcicella sp.]
MDYETNVLPGIIIYNEDTEFKLKVPAICVDFVIENLIIVKQNGVHKLFLVQFVIDVRNKNYKKGDFSFENFTGQILYRELE